MQDRETDKTDDLVDAFLCLSTKGEARKFLRDLLTEAELIELANRLRAARLLNEGVPYAIIEEKLGLSSTTIARISKWLNQGKGGYRLVLERLKQKGAESD